MSSEALDGGWGWVVLFGIIIVNLTVSPISQCFGIIFQNKFQILGITAAQTSTILHLNSFIMCILGLLCAPLFKKFSYRQVAFAGCSVICLGIVLTSFANSFQIFLLTYCIILGIGQGVLFPAITMALNTYFRKKRSVAMGISVSLTGLGPIITPHICTKLLTEFGTSGTVLLLGAIAMHSFAGALLMKPLKKDVQKASEQPKNVGNETDCAGDQVLDECLSKNNNRSLSVPELEQLLAFPAIINPGKFEPVKYSSVPDFREGIQTIDVSDLEKAFLETRSDNQMTKNPSELEDQSRHSVLKRMCIILSNSFNLELLKDLTFVSIVLGMGISFVSELNFAYMTPFVLGELASFSTEDIAFAMSIQATADIGGRIIVPLMAQKWHWNCRYLYMGSLFLSICGRTVLTSFSDRYSIVLWNMALLGTAKGIKAVFQALIVPNYVSLEKLPAASGLLMVINGILSLGFGPIIGYIHDATGTYVTALHFTSFLSGLCLALWIFEFIFCKPKQTNS